MTTTPCQGALVITEPEPGVLAINCPECGDSWTTPKRGAA